MEFCFFSLPTRKIYIYRLSISCLSIIDSIYESSQKSGFPEAPNGLDPFFLPTKFRLSSFRMLAYWDNSLRALPALI